MKDEETRMSLTKQFTVYTNPHVANIGEHTLEFRPEVYSDETLDAWVVFRHTMDEIRDKYRVPDDATDEEKKAARAPELVRERAAEVNQATRDFLAAHMTPESLEKFAGIRLPDRVMLELQQWLQEIYGQRPTMSSSDSSIPSSATDSSTSTSTTSEGGSTP